MYRILFAAILLVAGFAGLAKADYPLEAKIVVGDESCEVTFPNDISARMFMLALRDATWSPSDRSTEEWRQYEAIYDGYATAAAEDLRSHLAKQGYWDSFRDKFVTRLLDRGFTLELSNKQSQ